ncbi:tyrosine-type recombinase/integrase [Streptomyces sp. PU-14G]|uniref:tyrosine-type recombinase/integrase n=1 Tax=Streptomyces sp. PU-14G TaxID=2800808 RepID=UPI0034DF7E59
MCTGWGPHDTLHDLRHLAATISITEGVPLVVVSKTLRHSMLSTTAKIYSHLTSQAARQAVDQISRGLDHAGQPTRRLPEDATTSRPPPADAPPTR